MSRDAHLRARPALADRRPGRVHDGVRALRGGPGAPGASKVVAESRRRPRPSHRSALGRRDPEGRSPTRTPSSSCDVCGRTLLRGEHAESFLAGGPRRMVCELCTPRAAHEGWIREGLDDARRARPRRARARARCSAGCAAACAEAPEPAAEGAPRGRADEPVHEAPPTRRSPSRAVPERTSPTPACPTSPRRARGPRGAHQRRAQGRARRRAVQRLRAPAHGRRRRALARARRSSPCARRPPRAAS